MLQRLGAFLGRERDYLRAVSRDQRYLLGAIFLYNLALPMITTFSNTYLWRQSQDPVVLAIFNIGLYAGLPMGFFLNGLLLRRISPQKLCALGCVLQGLVPLALVFLGAEAQAYAIGLGSALGLAGGFYWGNRNLLTSQVSQGPGRFKYISLENVVQIFSAVLAPLSVGWFLVIGDRTGAYSVQTAYEWSALVGFFLLLFSGRLVVNISQSFQPVTRLLITKVSSSWRRMRVLDFFNGCVSGLETSLIFFALLTFLDQENAIGSLLSITAVLAVLGMYMLGKRLKHRDHTSVLGLWTAITFVGKLTFVIAFSTFGTIVLQMVEGLMRSFRWASMSAVMYETLEAQQPDKHASLRYAYLMDREFILDLGRVCTLVGVVVAYEIQPHALIRYGLLAVVLFQVLMIFLTRGLTQQTPHVAKTSVLKTNG